MRPLRLCLWLCLACAVAAPAAATEESLDAALARVIAARGLSPLEAPPLALSPRFRLGQMLFFDPILSGTRDVACATCHLLGRGTSDGVDLAVGVDAVGLAEERRPRGVPRVHPRNSMDLWNRGHPSVRNMFWDGRVSEIEAPVSRFRTPMGDYLPDGMESVLAAQALFPLAGEEGDAGPPERPLRARPPRRPRRPAQRDRSGGRGSGRGRAGALRRGPRRAHAQALRQGRHAARRLADRLPPAHRPGLSRHPARRCHDGRARQRHRPLPGTGLRHPRHAVGPLSRRR